MSATVDSRILEMHFDNSDFMDKISETISALEKLNREIDSLNSNGFDSNLTAGLDDGPLADFQNELSNIESRFSLLDVVGMSIINRLTNAAMTSIHNVYNAMTRDFSAGGMQRALNLEQAKFLLEGLKAPVQDVMKNVDDAVTGTAYGLDEAAKAAASFYASGVKAGPKMESALKSVAGVAAMTGSDFASIADIFTTTAGQGKVMTMQLRMLEGRGLNAAAVLAKSMGKTEEEIRDMVTKGKIDFETFSKAMDEAFGEHAKDANKTFTGALANMQTALKRMGAKFYAPGLVYLRDIFNELRNVINSFSNSLDTVAVEAFKNFGSSASQTIVSVLHSLDELKVFETFGRGISNLFASFLMILKSIGKAFNQAFPSNLSKKLSSVSELANSFESFSIAVLMKTTYHMQAFINLLSALFSAVGAAINIISGFATALFGVGKSASVTSHPLVKITELIRNFFAEINRRSESLTIFETISKGITAAGNIISKVFDMAVNAISKFFSTLSEGIATVDSFEKSAALMGLMITGIFADQNFRIIKAQFTRLFGKNGVFRGGMLETINEFLRIIELPGQIVSTLDQVTKTLRAMTREVYAKALVEIGAGILAIAIALKIIADLDPGKLVDSLAAVTILFGEMTAVLIILMKTLSSSAFTESLKGVYAMGSMTNSLMKIGIAMILMASALKMIAELKPEELARGLVAMTLILGELLGFVVAIDKFGGKVDASTGIAIMAIAESINIIAKAVQAFSGLSPEELAKGLGSVVALMTAIFGMIVGISKFGSAGGSAGMAAAGAGMILIATAIRILTPAVSELGKLDLATIGKGLMAIAVGLGVMAAASNFVNLEGAAGIFVMALALSSLSISIQRLGSMDVKDLAKGLITIGIALGMFAAAGILLAPVAPVMMTVAGAMFAMSAAIAVLGAGLMMIGAGLTMISAGIISFASVSQTALLMFSNSLIIIIRSIVNIFPTIAAEMAKSFVTFMSTLASLAPQLRESFTKIITEIIGAFEDNVPRIIKAGREFLLGFLEGIAKDIRKLTKTGISIVTGIINGFAEMQASIIESGINLMLAFINGLAEGIRTHKEEIRSAIFNLGSAILEAFCSFFGIASPSTVMKEKGVDLVLGLIEGIKEKARKVPTALINGVKSALSKLKLYAKRFVSSGVQIVSNIISGIKSKISKIASGIKDGLSHAASTIKNYINNFKNAGKNLVLGIANGIRNGLRSVISAVGSIASRALSAFKRKLGINSPSKEFAKLGIGIPEGVVKGIGNGASMVKKAVGSMSDTTIKSMHNAIKHAVDEIQNGSDFNPVISPILDLTDIHRKQSEIDSLFGARTMDLAYSASNAATITDNAMYNNSIERLIDKFNTFGKEISSSRPNTISNTFNIDGTEDPEIFANKFVNQLKMQMRTY